MEEPIALGIDVGGTKILSVAIRADGAVLAEARVPSEDSRGGLLHSIEASVASITSELGSRAREITAYGVGVPGLVDGYGVLHETPNLPMVEELAVREAVGSIVLPMIDGGGQARIVVDNDGTCAAAGEATFGAARGLSDAIVVTLGTGIGGGVIADHRILRGGRGFAGEIGHMVVAEDGPPCVCGRLGCWEQFVSGTGHARLARDAAAKGRAEALLALAGGEVSAITSSHVFAAARAGDLEAWGIVDTIARYLALGIANLVEILDPIVVILGGGVANDADVFLPLARDYFAQTRRGTGERAVDIRSAELGERSGALGAAAMALGLGSEGLGES